MNFGHFRKALATSELEWLEGPEAGKQAEDFAFRRECARARALILATYPDRWGNRLTIEQAKYVALRDVNDNAIRYGDVPIEPPL